MLPIRFLLATSPSLSEREWQSARLFFFQSIAAAIMAIFNSMAMM
jgi:hypothetical protein